MTYRKLFVLIVVVTTALLIASCGGAAPTPQTVVQTVVVEKEVQKEVKVVETVEVVKEKEVVKEVEVVVTPTAEPAAEQSVINGFPTSDENEAKTAQAAFDAADKGQPDPAWKGKKN